MESLSVLAVTQLEKAIDRVQLSTKKRMLRAELLGGNSLSKMQCLGFFAGNSATSMVANTDVTGHM